ncbi:hypothetical protein VE23_17780 [Paenibacillus sp. D9]|nr:hypothetical protein VE23_17780 [Paenibacillus sp. D9]
MIPAACVRMTGDAQNQFTRKVVPPFPCSTEFGILNDTGRHILAFRRFSFRKRHFLIILMFQRDEDSVYIAVYRGAILPAADDIGDSSRFLRRGLQVQKKPRLLHEKAGLA